MAKYTLKMTLLAGAALPCQLWQADAKPAGETPTPPAAEPTFDEAFKLLSEDAAPVIVDNSNAVDTTAKPEGEAETTAQPTIVRAGDEGTTEDDKGLPDPSKVNADGTTAKTPEQLAQEVKDAATAEAAAKEPKPEPVKVFDPQEFLQGLREAVATPVKETKQPEPDKPYEPAYTEEEKALIKTYETEFPDVARAEQAIRREEYKQLLGYVFAQIAPALEGIGNKTEQISQQSHIQQLQATIPDYATIREPVLKWINEQPDFIKAAYTEVASKGSVAQIVQLVDRYRKETGTAAPAAQEPETKLPTPVLVSDNTTPEAKAAATKKAAVVKGLIPVTTKRTNLGTGQIDSEDFDGAFDAFSKVS